MIASLISLLLVTGLSGIVAQTVLIRECLILYGGNELSIGVTIGAWVVWEALGAFIGGRWPRGARGAAHAFIAAGLIFGIVFPASIYAIRAFKEGEVRILITTDLSARGLDASLVSHVINFDIPPHYVTECPECNEKVYTLKK